MRVGIVLEHLDPSLGGLEHWTWQFVRNMASRGHEVHVLAQSFSESPERNGIHFHKVRRDGSRLDYAAVLEHRLQELDLDIVHETGAGWYCDVFQPHFGSRAALLEQRLQVLPRTLRPAKRLAMGLLPRYRTFRNLARRQYVDDGRLFLALSNKVADDFVRFHGVPRESIRLVPNGVDCTRFSPQNRREFRAPIRRELGLDDDTVLLLLIAHNFRLKGVGPAIRALAKLVERSQRVHLAVLGGRRHRPYPLLARTLGVDHLVSFLGPRPDPVPYLAAADLLVHPSFYDTCSLVALEAFASGIPAVLSRATGIDELMTDGCEGYVVSDPRRTADLADRICRLLDSTVRAAMGAAARQLALRHSFENNCDQIEGIYDEIVARRKAGRAA